MNKRERFEAFLNNAPVDRVPSGIFHHYMPTPEWLAGTKEPRSFEKLVAGQLVTKRRTDPDICKIMNDVLMIMPIDISMVKEPKDLKDVIPPAMDSIYVSRTLELTERVLKFYEDEDIPSFVTSFAPIFSLRHRLEDNDPNHRDVMGELFAADPQAAYDGMKTVAERTMEIHQKLFDEFPLDGIYFSVNNQNSVLSDELYRQIATPIEKEMIADINKRGITFMHICGTRGQTNNLKLFTDYDFAAVNWAVYSENVSLKEGKELFGGRPVMGGFAQTGLIYDGTEEAIKAEVKRILDETGQLGVMIGADCTVPMDIDEHHFVWVREAAEEYAAEHR